MNWLCFFSRICCTLPEPRIQLSPKNGPGAPGGQSWTTEWLKFDNNYFNEIKEKRYQYLLVLPTDAALFEDPAFKIISAAPEPEPLKQPITPPKSKLQIEALKEAISGVVADAKEKKRKFTEPYGLSW